MTQFAIKEKGLLSVSRLSAPIAALICLLILIAMHRPPICTCGYIELWHGAIDSGNSQHIFDWYSPSHFIHGLIFFGLSYLFLRTLPFGLRLGIATVIEGIWEILENSPIIIDRYRSATAALGYSGDSILNSMSDIGCMALGFYVASRLPWKATVVLAVALEIITLIVIRDNLTLNILMLTYPLESIKQWQLAL